MAKYKKLRNQVNCKIRKETIQHNENRVAKANNELEVWKIVNEVVKLKQENEWSLKEDDLTTNDHQDIADIFNKYCAKS